MGVCFSPYRAVAGSGCLRSEEGDRLQPSEKLVVLGVSPYPDPGNLLAFEQSNGTVAEGHSNRVDGLSIVHLLEVKAGMSGISSEEAIRALSVSLNVRR